MSLSPHAQALYEEFVKDWRATLCPSISDTLSLAHPDDREPLSEALWNLLATDPTPPYTARQLHRFKEKIDDELSRRLTACADPRLCVRCNWPLEPCRHLEETL